MQRVGRGGREGSVLIADRDGTTVVIRLWMTAAWVVARRSMARGSGVGADSTLVKVPVRARTGRMEKRMVMCRGVSEWTLSLGVW